MARRLALFLAVFVLIAAPAVAETVRFAAPAGGDGLEDGPGGELALYSTTDLDAAQPLIEGFQAQFPGVAIAFDELNSLDLHNRVIEETDSGAVTADLVFSSAMDLQVKLVNDGYAQRQDGLGRDLPAWAVWRDAAFGVTYEPAVIVYHKPSFEGREPPKTRAELRDLLVTRSDEMRGRIATYDIERSGVGFMFVARDQENSDDVWPLISQMGEAGVKLYTSSAAIIDRVAQGRFLIGYNVIGSYAAAMAATRPDLGVVAPEDYTVVLSRIALVPRAARSPELGSLFLDFLLSVEGQRILAEQSGLNAVHPAIDGDNTASALRRQLGARLRPIGVGPGLLVYLDQAKRRRLMERWNAALVGDQ